MDNSPLRWYLVPDFRNGEGRIIYLMNHSYCDGIGGLMMMAGLEKNYEGMAQIPKMPAYLDFFQKVVAPLSAIQLFLEYQTLPMALNPVKCAY